MRQRKQKGQEVMERMEVKGSSVYRLAWDYIESNAYVMINGTDALIIDPVDTEEFWNFLKDSGIRRATVVLTHEHFDHIGGLNRLRCEAECTVYAHSECSRLIGSASKNLSSTANVVAEFNDQVGRSGIVVEPFACAPADHTFDHESKFLWQGHEIRLLATPGHSSGSICAVLDERLLFSGDTLLGVPTITRLPGGSKKAFRETTLPKLEKMRKQIEMVFPGHGNVGQMEGMLQVNTRKC